MFKVGAGQHFSNHFSQLGPSKSRFKLLKVWDGENVLHRKWGWRKVFLNDQQNNV